MTTESNENLIGYDPLAWMSEDEETSSAEPESDDVAVESANTTNTKEAWVSEELEPEEAVIDETALGSKPETDTIEHTKPEIMLDATLNIQGVSELHDKFLKTLQDHSVIEIDASAVKMADTASFQLLLVLKQEAIKQQKEVNFEFPSDKFIDSAKLLGIYEMLGLDQASSGFF